MIYVAAATTTDGGTTKRCARVLIEELTFQTVFQQQLRGPPLSL